MSEKTLTKEQSDFLEECNLKFEDRFTEEDSEFMKVFHADIPPPPIMCPWYGRSRFSNNRGRSYEGSSNNYSNNRGTHEDYRNDSGRYNRERYNDRRYRTY